MTQLWGFGSEEDFRRAGRSIVGYERDVGTNRVPRGTPPIFSNDFPVIGIWNGEASADCPAFGLMLANGSQTTSSGKVLKGKRPDTFGCQYNCFVVGEEGALHGAGGAIQVRPPFLAKYDSADGTPTVGQMWGPQSGTFLLKYDTGGFRVLWTEDTTNHLVWVVPSPFIQFVGTAAAAIAMNATGTVNFGSGSVQATADFGAVVNGAIVYCVWQQSGAIAGYWSIVQTNICP